ncbi:MAG: GTP 3',8-cyclase MoaA, partial [Pirellulaceae bacterium]
MSKQRPPLTDSLGRIHSNLRMSVTDRCNIRCFYCMPEENVEFKPRHEILTFEELGRFARISASMGVNKIRITGGEPLVRNNLASLIAELNSIVGIEDIALTTNAMLLANQADALRQAGLNRLNISLDTLNDDTFFRLSRRRGIDQVLAGIEAAQQVGFDMIRLNAIAIRGMTESEILPLARFALERQLELRFIEFMPLDADDN